MYLNKEYDLEPVTTITINKKRYKMVGSIRLLLALHEEFGEVTDFTSGVFAKSFQDLATVIKFAINDDTLSYESIQEWVAIFNGVDDTRCLVYEFLAVTIGGKKNELETRKKVDVILSSLKDSRKEILNSLGQNTDNSA